MGWTISDPSTPLAFIFSRSEVVDATSDSDAGGSWPSAYGNPVVDSFVFAHTWRWLSMTFVLVVDMAEAKKENLSDGTTVVMVEQARAPMKGMNLSEAVEYLILSTPFWDLKRKDLSS